MIEIRFNVSILTPTPVYEWSEELLNTDCFLTTCLQLESYHEIGEEPGLEKTTEREGKELKRKLIFLPAARTGSV